MMKSIVKRLAVSVVPALLATSSLAPSAAHAQAGDGSGCLGTVTMIGGSYCPRSTADAHGQLLPIASNTALFSIYGTMYGGDGRTTFGLPDLRGRIVLGVGAGPGIGSAGTQGAKFGAESFTLTNANLPAHSHTVFAAGDNADSSNPSGALPGRALIYHSTSGTGRGNMSGNAINNTGNGVFYSKISPAQAIRYCVLLQGIYCSRN